MDRDEILQKSRQENLGEDEYEREISLRSARLGMKVGLLACCIVATVSVAVTDQLNNGCWIIYFSIWAASSIDRYRHLRQRRDLGFAICSVAAGAMFAVRFACELLRAV